MSEKVHIINILYNSKLIWRTVSRLMNEAIPLDHPRRYASRVIRWYDLIHSTWYSTPDQVTIMIMCIYQQTFNILISHTQMHWLISVLISAVNFIVFISTDIENPYQPYKIALTNLEGIVSILHTSAILISPTQKCWLIRALIVTVEGGFMMNPVFLF